MTLLDLFWNRLVCRESFLSQPTPYFKLTVSRVQVQSLDFAPPPTALRILFRWCCPARPPCACIYLVVPASS